MHKRLTAVLFLMACNGVTLSPPKISVLSANTSPVPAWKVENFRVDDSCATFLDYCVFTSCDIVSTGSLMEQGTATLSLQQDEKALAHHEALSLGAAARQTITHQFGEARLFGDAPHGGCKVEYTGTNATCSVQNTGGSGHADLRAKIILKDGTAKEAVEKVSLNAGESRSVEFAFPGLDPRETIRIECGGP